MKTKSFKTYLATRLNQAEIAEIEAQAGIRSDHSKNTARRCCKCS